MSSTQMWREFPNPKMNNKYVELKPCSKCGYTRVELKPSGSSWNAKCDQCGREGMAHNDQQEAVKAWNALNRSGE